MYKVITAARKSPMDKMKFDSVSFYRKFIDWMNKNAPEDCEIWQEHPYQEIEFRDLVFRKKTDFVDLIIQCIEDLGYTWYVESSDIRIINQEIFITLGYNYTPRWKSGWITFEWNNSNIMFEPWYNRYMKMHKS